MSENLLSISGLHKSIAGRQLLDGVSLGIDAGEKVGLIGANGAGKSTLLSILSRVQSPDEGQVNLRKGTRVAVLEQMFVVRGDPTVREVLLEPFSDLRTCIAEYEVAAANMRDDASTLLERIEQLGGWEYEHRIDQAASRVGLGRLDDAVSQLSGGERRRVALAKLLLTPADLLLLDEPTNHLDAETVDWLEEWLRQTPAAVLLVTHDRYVLDEVVQRMVEVRDGQLRTYAGNYTEYLAARAIEEAHRARTRHRQLRLLMGELDWARRSPKARTTKSRARLERIEKTQQEVQSLTGDSFGADFRFGDPPRLGGDILRLSSVHMGYPGEPELISGLTLELNKGERIGILGSNGSGKTTLLRLVMGELRPTAGEVRLGKNTRVAYFDQHRTELDQEQTLKRALAPQSGDLVFPRGGKGVHVASWLDRFGFAASTHKRLVRTLSGGERNRLALAKFMLTDANLIILDEPSNDLDIPSLNLLEEAIADFDGCVLLVSHDRYLLDKVVTGILAFEREYEGPGTVTIMQGSYSHYQQNRLQELKRKKQRSEQRQRRPQSTQGPPGKGTPTAGLTYAERLELQGLEAEIEAADAELVRLEARLADPDLWQQAREEAPGVQLEVQAAQKRSAELYARWEELLTKQEAQ